LVARIRNGERAAEAELVARYSRGVTLILRRAAAEPAVAEDLFQEIFLLLLEKIRAGELRDPDRLSGFVCSLARNMTVDYFRRRQPAETLADSGDSNSVPEPSPGPLERMMRIEDARSVRQVLSELPSDRDREILFRFYIGEEDKGRICADLGLTALHFNRVLHRARDRFREIFQQAAERRANSKTG
jgi:RNA polymerase sigma-70 factor (ECF subfamily)